MKLIACDVDYDMNRLYIYDYNYRSLILGTNFNTSMNEGQINFTTEHNGISQEYVKVFFLTSLSRLFHSYRDEPTGRWGQTGVPLENHLTHPQAELGLSHTWPVHGSNQHQSQR